MLIIGSTALKHHFPNHTRWANPVDTDLMCGTFEEAESRFKDKEIGYYPISGNILVGKENNKFTEIEIGFQGSGKLIMDYTESIGMYTASPELCLAFKLSHRYRKDSPHFWKTREDIFALRELGVKIIEPRIAEIFRVREAEVLANRYPNLNRTKEQFFSSDGVTYLMDHDRIHEIVKKGLNPAYTYFKKDGHEVYSDVNKFNLLPELIKRRAVYEEAAVLALERAILPHPNKLKYKDAFMLSLSKVCSSITSGWFREYAWENADKVVDMYDENNFCHYESKCRKVINESSSIRNT